MEASDVARRRLYQISCHLGLLKDEQALSAGSLTALVCTSGSGVTSSRKDNRLLFARQGSHTQAFYMRQTTGKQVSFANEEEIDVPLSMFEATGLNGSKRAKAESQQSDPLFSKPVSEPKGGQDSGGYASADVPLFARISAESAEKGKTMEREQPEQQNNKLSDFEWFPRMDVMESSSAYVITIELPGVNVDGIRVEVDNNSLIVTGSRSTEWWLNGNKINGRAVYHRRELAQGPYRALWRIPDNINTDAITAEFIDGFLRVVVPKSVH